MCMSVLLAACARDRCFNLKRIDPLGNDAVMVAVITRYRCTSNDRM